MAKSYKKMIIYNTMDKLDLKSLSLGFAAGMLCLHFINKCFSKSIIISFHKDENVKYAVSGSSNVASYKDYVN